MSPPKHANRISPGKVYYVGDGEEYLRTIFGVPALSLTQGEFQAYAFCANNLCLERECRVARDKDEDEATVSTPWHAVGMSGLQAGGIIGVLFGS